MGFLVMTACGGSLSEDQRKKIKEDMQEHKIVRVTDAEITEAAFEKGRQVMRVIGKTTHNIAKADSLGDALKADIKWITPGTKNAQQIEQQLIEAYLESFINGGMADNIQKLGTDSLLYTAPVTEKLVDGSESVKGMWSIRLSKKDLILAMDK
jgi:hypothetical protein